MVSNRVRVGKLPEVCRTENNTGGWFLWDEAAGRRPPGRYKDTPHYGLSHSCLSRKDGVFCEAFREKAFERRYEQISGSRNILYFHVMTGKRSRNFKLQLLSAPHHAPTLVNEDLLQPASSSPRDNTAQNMRWETAWNPRPSPALLRPHRLWTARVDPPNCPRPKRGETRVSRPFPCSFLKGWALP